MSEFGERHKCYRCGCKFYDLNKPEAICPRCGESQINEENRKELKRRKRRVLGKPKGEAKGLPEEREVIDTLQDNIGEYVLDMEDIVLEESAEDEEDNST